jgi:hypothetical protein
MNNDGIFEEGGGGGVPDDIDIISVCAVTGNFQNLGVGPCGNVNYKFPPNKADNEFTRGIIVSEGATVALAGPTAAFLTTYSIIGPFVRNLVIPDGNYTIQDLLETLKTTIEAQFAIDGATNTVTLTLDLTGRINFTLNAGNIISILLSNTGGLL